MKSGTVLGISVQPKIAAVGLDDGARNRQPETHAVTLGCEKGFKDVGG
jgi:hypothetical protein